MIAITKKKVSRWFYKGKGYASETAALKALALDTLKAEIMNKSGGRFWQRVRELDALSGFSEEEGNGYRDAMGELWAEKFPHSEDGSCFQRSNGCNRSRGIAWCKLAKKQWIDAKVSDLRAEYSKQV